MLDAHNAIRARVGVPPLVWSDQLARVAQEWANHLIDTGRFGHRPNNQLREERLHHFGQHYVSSTSGQLLGHRVAGIRYSQQYLLRRLRPLNRRSCGERHGQWAAPSLPIGVERSGCATTIRQEMSSATDRTEFLQHVETSRIDLFTVICPLEPCVPQGLRQLCLDDDARGSPAWKQANKAIRAARAAGHVVLIVNTWQVRHGEKTDLNDILRQSGPEGPALLRQRISADAIKQVRATATNSWPSPRASPAARKGHYTCRTPAPAPQIP